MWTALTTSRCRILCPVALYTVTELHEFKEKKRKQKMVDKLGYLKFWTKNAMYKTMCYENKVLMNVQKYFVGS